MPSFRVFRVFGVFRGCILKRLVVDHRRDFLPPNTRNTRKKIAGPPWSSFRVFSVFRGCAPCSVLVPVRRNPMRGTIRFVRYLACFYSRSTTSPPLRENRASQVSFGKSSFKLVTDPSNIAMTVLPL